MGSGDAYRRLSAECLQAAEHILDQGNKAVLLSIAQAWLRLAEFADSGNVLAQRSLLEDDRA
jgi:hypothetical protein